MNIFTNYRDLKVEIECYKLRLDDLKRELYALERMKFSYSPEVYLEKNHSLCNRIAIITAIIQDKKRTLREWNKKLKSMSSLESQIAYKRICEGKPLKAIAEELHISESWAKKKSADIRKTL
ncbi:hypothetical protein [Thermotalea metallivorans]|uniref:Uncharacterized protein n=1 Tax=Thermotalea metallivorans TaxID=520762 RepID=A0A140LCJ6_9FIRM|nr:hypothetical protein [Thermotalea metallivorans]KXG78271.1 hypothetical protein AN619_02460 [Thermotalea metallivorans]